MRGNVTTLEIQCHMICGSRKISRKYISYDYLSMILKDIPVICTEQKILTAKLRKIPCEYY